MVFVKRLTYVINVTFVRNLHPSHVVHVIDNRMCLRVEMPAGGVDNFLGVH